MLDPDGDVITYIPISGLIEGEETDPIIVTAENLPISGTLRADLDVRMTVFARESGIGSFIDIGTSPIDLSSLGPGNVDFDMKVQANSPIVGLERVPVFVGTTLEEAADWLA